MVETTGDAALASSESLLGGNLLINLLLAGSLGQVWSMVNGLQIVSILPLMNVKSPGNANTFNLSVNELASFDFVDFESFTLSLVYFPESDPVHI